MIQGLSLQRNATGDRLPGLADAAGARLRPLGMGEDPAPGDEAEVHAPDQAVDLPQGTGPVAPAGHRQAGLDGSQRFQAGTHVVQDLGRAGHHARAEAGHDDGVEPRQALQPGHHPRVDTVVGQPAQGGGQGEMGDEGHPGMAAQHAHGAQAHRQGVDEHGIGTAAHRQVVEITEAVHLVGDIGQVDLGLPRPGLRSPARRAQEGRTLGQGAPVHVRQHLVILGDIQAT